MIKLKVLLNISNVFLLCLGAMIGVGFLSGAEIWSFFASFGENFAFSIMTIFLFLFIFVVKIIKIYNLDNDVTMQKSINLKQKNTFLLKNNFRTSLLNLNIILLSSAMFSGLKNVVVELFPNGQIVVFMLVVLFVFVVVLIGSTAVSKFNLLMIIALFFVFLLIGMRFEIFGNETLSSLRVIKKVSFVEGLKSVLMAVIYIFLNTSQLVPIFKESNIRFSKRGMYVFSLIFSMVFCLLVVILTLFLSANSYLSTYDMPLLNFFVSVGGLWEWLFVCSILGGLLSTLLVCLIGLKNSLTIKLKSPFLSAYLAVFLSLIFGFLPFNFFINVIYPIIGVTSFVCFVLL